MIYFGLTYNQDSMADKLDYVQLGLVCAEVCRALDRGVGGKKQDDLSQSAREVIVRLTRWVKPVVYTLDSPLTTLLIAELWQRSRGRSSNRASGTQSPGLSMRRMIRKHSPHGSQTSEGQSKPSTCVPLPSRSDN